MWKKLSQLIIKPKPTWISEDELPSLLATHNDDLVKDLFTLVRAANDSEADRTKTIDSKAASHFSLIGILASAGVLAISAKSDQPFGRMLQTEFGRKTMACILLLLIGSIFFLYRAVKVSSANSAPNERDLFLEVASLDGRDSPKWRAYRQWSERKEPDKPTGHNFRRFLCDHYWKLYRSAFEKNERKASFLGYGQDLTFASMAVIFGLQIYILIGGDFMSQETKPQPPVSSTTPSTSSSPPPLRAAGTGRPVCDSQSPPSLTSAPSGRFTGLSEGTAKKGSSK